MDYINVRAGMEAAGIGDFNNIGDTGTTEASRRVIAALGQAATALVPQDRPLRGPGCAADIELNPCAPFECDIARAQPEVRVHVPPEIDAAVRLADEEVRIAVAVDIRKAGERAGAHIDADIRIHHAGPGGGTPVPLL